MHVDAERCEQFSLTFSTSLLIATAAGVGDRAAVGVGARVVDALIVASNRALVRHFALDARRCLADFDVDIDADYSSAGSDDVGLIRSICRHIVSLIGAYDVGDCMTRLTLVDEAFAAVDLASLEARCLV
jgi:hypothetical protein